MRVTGSRNNYRYVQPTIRKLNLRSRDNTLSEYTRQPLDKAEVPGAILAEGGGGSELGVAGRIS